MLFTDVKTGTRRSCTRKAALYIIHLCPEEQTVLITDRVIMAQPQSDTQVLLAQAVRDPADCVVVVDSARRARKTTVLQEYARELAAQGKTILVLAPSANSADSWRAELADVIETKKVQVAASFNEEHKDRFDVIFLDEYQIFQDAASASTTIQARNAGSRLIMVGTPDSEWSGTRVTDVLREHNVSYKHHVIPSDL